MSAKTATIIGSTGLIGSYLLKHLKGDDTYSVIRLLVRRPVQNNHPKVEVKLVDFNDHESLKLGIDGSNVIFCAVGTTQKKAGGNKDAYRKVDYDIAVNAARFCKETGCQKFVLVSSVGANSKSNNFYLKLKGEVEDSINDMDLDSFSIFRPSLLLGNRKEQRPAEKLGQIAAPLFSSLLFGKWSKYKPIHAEDVAQAMIVAAKLNKNGSTIYEHTDIKRLLLKQG